MSIVRTKKAENDIKEIYKYSFISFGEEQAEKYYEGLEVKFKSILEKTAHSKDYSFIEPDLKRTNYGSHAIYFRVINKNEIIIIRVLNQKMDELQHLRDE